MVSEMQNSWDVRPRQKKGDPIPDPLFQSVGVALTQWERLESRLAELFDALVTGAESPTKSNRSAFLAFRSVSSSSARTELVTEAAPRALLEWPELRDRSSNFLLAVSRFGARRNEIAHGMVCSLGEHGFYLSPNNVNRNKWSKEGAAKYQYTSDDVFYYAEEFGKLRVECEDLVTSIFERRTKAGTNAPASRLG